jgi:thiamine monophosphate synthase
MKLKNSLKYYYFPRGFEIKNFSKLIKIQNISVIVDINNDNFKIKDNFFKTIKFCRQNRIPYYLTNNYKLAIKHKANGIYLTSDYKIQIYRGIIFSKLKIIGSAHNQNEFFLKRRQFCKEIALSPLFATNKYSINKILNIHRFNLISNKWNIRLIALGGINYLTLRKINMTKILGLGFNSFIETL